MATTIDAKSAQFVAHEDGKLDSDELLVAFSGLPLATEFLFVIKDADNGATTQPWLTVYGRPVGSGASFRVWKSPPGQTIEIDNPKVTGFGPSKSPTLVLGAPATGPAAGAGGGSGAGPVETKDDEGGDDSVEEKDEGDEEEKKDDDAVDEKDDNDEEKGDDDADEKGDEADDGAAAAAALERLLERAPEKTARKDKYFQQDIRFIKMTPELFEKVFILKDDKGVRRVANRGRDITQRKDKATHRVARRGALIPETFLIGQGPFGNWDGQYLLVFYSNKAWTEFDHLSAEAKDIPKNHPKPQVVLRCKWHPEEKQMEVIQALNGRAHKKRPFDVRIWMDWDNKYVPSYIVRAKRLKRGEKGDTAFDATRPAFAKNYFQKCGVDDYPLVFDDVFRAWTTGGKKGKHGEAVRFDDPLPEGLVDLPEQYKEYDLPVEAKKKKRAPPKKPDHVAVPGAVAAVKAAIDAERKAKAAAGGGEKKKKLASATNKVAGRLPGETEEETLKRLGDVVLAGGSPLKKKKKKPAAAAAGAAAADDDTDEDAVDPVVARIIGPTDSQFFLTLGESKQIAAGVKPLPDFKGRYAKDLPESKTDNVVLLFITPNQVDHYYDNKAWGKIPIQQRSLRPLVAVRFNTKKGRITAMRAEPNDKRIVVILDEKQKPHVRFFTDKPFSFEPLDEVTNMESTFHVWRQRNQWLADFKKFHVSLKAVPAVAKQIAEEEGEIKAAAEVKAELKAELAAVVPRVPVLDPVFACVLEPRDSTFDLTLAQARGVVRDAGVLDKQQYFWQLPDSSPTGHVILVFVTPGQVGRAAETDYLMFPMIAIRMQLASKVFKEFRMKITDRSLRVLLANDGNVYPVQLDETKNDNSFVHVDKLDIEQFGRWGWKEVRPHELQAFFDGVNDEDAAVEAEFEGPYYADRSVPGLVVWDGMRHNQLEYDVKLDRFLCTNLGLHLAMPLCETLFNLASTWSMRKGPDPTEHRLAHAEWLIWRVNHGQEMIYRAYLKAKMNLDDNEFFLARDKSDYPKL